MSDLPSLVKKIYQSDTNFAKFIKKIFFLFGERLNLFAKSDCSSVLAPRFLAEIIERFCHK